MDSNQENYNPEVGRDTDRISILLCSFNGSRFLGNQLKSILNQKIQDWDLWISDDGSTDETYEIIKNLQNRSPGKKISLRRGPGKGFAANFLSLACDPSINSSFYAFADQDDEWDEDKLTRALASIKQAPPDIPVIYCGRTRLIDAAGNRIGLSPLFLRRPCFENALVQSIAGGNTMVFNNAARRLLMQVSIDIPIVTHDWLLYILVTAAGGLVIYDPVPSISYRQHETNMIGMNMGWMAKIKRAYLLSIGEFRRWSDGNLAALDRISAMITKENQEVLGKFLKCRNGNLIERIINFYQARVYRQTTFGTLSLFVATVFKKI
jgi:glycosyltransferase involved in cell wall biosynthesis